MNDTNGQLPSESVPGQAKKNKNSAKGAGSSWRPRLNMDFGKPQKKPTRQRKPMFTTKRKPFSDIKRKPAGNQPPRKESSHVMDAKSVWKNGSSGKIRLEVLRCNSPTLVPSCQSLNPQISLSLSAPLGSPGGRGTADRSHAPKASHATQAVRTAFLFGSFTEESKGREPVILLLPNWKSENRLPRVSMTL